MLINHIGLSGGKDSTALWGWAINESGYPIESIRGSFADTQNEYKEVYDQIDILDAYGQKHGVAPIRRLSSVGFLQLALNKGRFPSARARFCTQHLKMIPFVHYCEELQLDGHDIIGHSGVRKSESIERSMLEEWGEQNGIRVRRPLLEWSIKDVWAAHRRFGLPINPLYVRGRKRVGCKLCCMSSKQDIRLTVKHHPEVIVEYAQWEMVVEAVRKARGKNYSAATFFNSAGISEDLKSLIVKNKAGKEIRCATIEDMARWSQTTRGGRYVAFPFEYEGEDDWNDFDAAAPCQSGYCE